MPFPLSRLPSLDLIRGFVAVGRRMSITLAAHDLHLTQSAVSRQIRALEETLGLKLLIRGHRSIAFTPEGERLFRSANSAVQQFQDVCGELKGALGKRMVTVSPTIAIAGLWLIPRLGTFLHEHPGIEVRLLANGRIVDLKSEDIDLAIRYGVREAMPKSAVHLFDEIVVPVAHPKLGLTVLDTPSILERLVLLEFDGPNHPWLQWKEWFTSQGWEGVRPRGVLRFNQYDQIIHAAVAGQGVALGRLALISPMLDDERLVILETPSAGPANEYAYWLIRAEANPRSEVLELMLWIRAEATASQTVLLSLRV